MQALKSVQPTRLTSIRGLCTVRALRSVGRCPGPQRITLSLAKPPIILVLVLSILLRACFRVPYRGIVNTRSVRV